MGLPATILTHASAFCEIFRSLTTGRRGSEEKWDLGLAIPGALRPNFLPSQTVACPIGLQPASVPGPVHKSYCQHTKAGWVAVQTLWSSAAKTARVNNLVTASAPAAFHEISRSSAVVKLQYLGMHAFKG